MQFQNMPVHFSQAGSFPHSGNTRVHAPASDANRVVSSLRKHWNTRPALVANRAVSSLRKRWNTRPALVANRMVLSLRKGRNTRPCTGRKPGGFLIEKALEHTPLRRSQIGWFFHSGSAGAQNPALECTGPTCC